MSNEAESFVAYVRHLRSEHQRLNEHIRQLEQQWPTDQAIVEPGATVTAMREALAALRADLVRHFEEEECGGCLEEAVSHQPALSQDVNRLELEHAELLDQLDELIERLRVIAHITASATGLEEDFRAFARRLRAHEAAETRILAESFRIPVE